MIAAMSEVALAERSARGKGDGQARDEVVIAAAELVGRMPGIDAQVGYPLQQQLQQNAQLGPGERRSWTGMNA